MTVQHLNNSTLSEVARQAYKYRLTVSAADVAPFILVHPALTISITAVALAGTIAWSYDAVLTPDESECYVVNDIRIVASTAGFSSFESTGESSTGAGIKVSDPLAGTYVIDFEVSLLPALIFNN